MSKILENLQEELNQYHDGAIVDNKSRMVIHDGSYIYLYLKESGVLEKASYSPELYHFLARPSCCSYSYDYRKDRVQIELMSHRKTGNRYKPTLGGFIQRWYHNHLPLDDFLANVVNDTKRKSVDHANADRHNHCKWNLSDVTASQNSRKNELSFRIKPPYFCYIAVTPDGEYRVACGYTGGIMQCVQTYFLCRDIDSLTDLLKAIVNMKVPPAGIRRSGTPKEILNREPKAFCASENFSKTATYAEWLLSLDEDEFSEWIPIKS